MKKLLLLLLLSLGFVGPAVAEIFIPANSHADGNSWTCNTSYYKDGSICRSVPANAYSNYNSNYWYCSTGYYKSGSSCKSAQANEVENDEIKELKIEVLFKKIKINWKAGSKDWKCKEGYKKSGNKCVRPPTDYWLAGSKVWTCNEGYKKSGNKCFKEGELPQDVIEREIAFFEAQLEAELAAQELMAEIEEEAKIEAIRGIAQIEYHPPKGSAQALVEAIAAAKVKRLWVDDIAAKVKSYWRYQGAEDDWECTVYVQQDVDGNVEAVNIQNCNTGDSDKARSFKNSIERAVYKASPLPSAPDDAVFDKEILFYFRAI